MSTGLESFTDPANIGAMYPFAGTPFANGEVILVIVGVALWVLWHIWEIRFEAGEHQKAIRSVKEGGKK